MPVMTSLVPTSNLIRPVLLLAAAHHVVAAPLLQPPQRLSRRDTDGGSNAVRIAVRCLDELLCVYL